MIKSTFHRSSQVFLSIVRAMTYVFLGVKLYQYLLVTSKEGNIFLYNFWNLKLNPGTSLVVQWQRFHASNAGGPGVRSLVRDLDPSCCN